MDKESGRRVSRVSVPAEKVERELCGREATVADIPDIEQLLRAAREESDIYRYISVDSRKLKESLRTMIVGQQYRVWVTEDSWAGICGVLIGIKSDIWFSKHKMATVLVMYAEDFARGHMPWLIKRFVRWAQSERNVVDISVNVASGMAKIDPDRVGKLYERMGFRYTGPSYYLPPAWRKEQ